MIIGGGHAGLSAAENIRKINSKAKISVISGESHLPYRRPEISFIIKQNYTSSKPLRTYPRSLLQSLRIEFFNDCKAVKIHANRKSVTVQDLNKKLKREINYDFLILTLGGIPAKPPIPGVTKRGVFTFRNFDDAAHINTWARSSKNVIIIGGSLIGLKLAEIFIRKGKKVTILERFDLVSSLIDRDMSLEIQKRAEEIGIDVRVNTTPDKIGGDVKVEYVKDAKGKIPADIVVLATGVKPNTDLAIKSDIGLGKFGIKVNDQMQTTVSNIFAAGDCVYTLDLITGKYTYMPIGSFAADQGRIAGINAAGGFANTQGFIRLQNESIFSLELASIGLTPTVATALGINNSKTIKLAIGDYGFPGSVRRRRFPMIKVVVDPSGRIIGGQILCQKYIGVYSVWILDAVKSRRTIDELNWERRPIYRSNLDFQLWKAANHLRNVAE